MLGLLPGLIDNEAPSMPGDSSRLLQVIAKSPALLGDLNSLAVPDLETLTHADQIVDER
jgi:hypothetical protein